MNSRMATKKSLKAILLLVERIKPMAIKLASQQLPMEEEEEARTPSEEQR